MIYLAKFIFLLLILAVIPLWRVMFDDYKKVKSMDGYDELSQWEKIRFHLVFTGITLVFSVFIGTMLMLIFSLPWN
jgi:hypothetical protein